MSLLRATKKATWLVFLVAVAGCGANEPPFPVNRVYLKKQELAAQIDLRSSSGRTSSTRSNSSSARPTSRRFPAWKAWTSARYCSWTSCGPRQGPSAAIRPATNSVCTANTALIVMACPATARARRPYFSNPTRATSAAGSSSTSRRRDRRRRRLTRIWSARSATAAGQRDARIQSVDRRRIGGVGRLRQVLVAPGRSERAYFESIDQLEDEYDRLVKLSLRDKAPEESRTRCADHRPGSRRRATLVARPGKSPRAPPPAAWDSAAAIRRGQALFAGKVANCEVTARRAWGRRKRRLRRLGGLRDRRPAEPRRDQAVLGLGCPGPCFRLALATSNTASTAAAAVRKTSAIAYHTTKSDVGAASGHPNLRWRGATVKRQNLVMLTGKLADYAEQTDPVGGRPAYVITATLVTDHPRLRRPPPGAVCRSPGVGAAGLPRGEPGNTPGSDGGRLAALAAGASRGGRGPGHVPRRRRGAPGGGRALADRLLALAAL